VHRQPIRLVGGLHNSDVQRTETAPLVPASRPGGDCAVSAADVQRWADMSRAIVAILTMFVGGMTYVLWRPESLTMFSWFCQLGTGQFVDSLRAVAAPYANTFPVWFYYSLPEALWLYSGLASFDVIWAGHVGPAAWVWSGILAALALASEIGQSLGLVPGRFDYMDIALLLVACIVGFPSRVGSTHLKRSRA